MKATGIVRRIDDLGRIVIPKDIRRQFHLREGDPMELLIEDDKIIFKRYSILEALDADVAKAAVKAIRKLGFTNAVIYDRDNVVAASCGQPVAKHGNRAVSSKSGAADFFENLGIKIMAEPEKTANLVSQTGFGFLMAPVYHSAMRFAAPVRKALGIKTIFLPTILSIVVVVLTFIISLCFYVVAEVFKVAINYKEEIDYTV